MTSIRELLTAERPLVLPGVYDGLSAKLAVRAGFRSVFVSGYCVSATRLGAPDIGLIERPEMLEVAEQVCRAVGVPVIVDADTGYGDPTEVERTVRALIRVGAAGCFLEDQVWPKRCGHMEGKEVVSLDEYLPKLTAALQARGGSGFHVTARTDALAVHGLDEAIARARAFADTGADAVFVEAPRSIEEMDRVRTAVPDHVRLVANMVEQGKTPLRTPAELCDAGYELVVVPVAGLLASSHALGRVYEALRRDGLSTSMQQAMTTFDDMNAFLGMDERAQRTRRG